MRRHYVTEGSPLDREAYERGTSVYVLDKVVPMLPHVLSNGICSLNPGTDRLTNTVEMMIAKDGTTVNYEVYPSVIHSDERMTYANVNKIFDGDQELKERYAHLGSLFQDMRQCAKAIRRMRNAKGAMEFESTESKIDVDENGRPVKVAPAERGEAEMMIEDFMIAANVSVANLMKKNHIPALYRIHEEPQAKKLRSFETLSYHLGHKLTIAGGSATPKKLQEYLNDAKDLECYPVLSKMLLRCMQKAKYDPVCVGHFSLAEDEYLHFTSPIRRYPDLIVHRMLRKYYFENGHSGDLYTDETNMKDYAVQSSVKER
ncbi:MAG: RNB domain-containing ribonuclease, partial [Clostridia bacterium]|nr:RNB domain-containing ribonuclease [Clostridia bacterium]